jgi:hypothetical protein
MAFSISGADALHREVEWFERYVPPEPGMVLVDEHALNDGRRFMFVWAPWRRDARPGEVCCWSEPGGAPAAGWLDRLRSGSCIPQL